MVEGEDFARVDWWGAELDGVTFTRCRFDDASLEELVTRRCVFDQCVLTGVRMGGAKHLGTAFLTCRFDRARLFDVTWDGCKLTGSQFPGAQLRPMTTTDSDWEKDPVLPAPRTLGAGPWTGPREADLTGADLRESDLSSADLDRVRLELRVAAWCGPLGTRSLRPAVPGGRLHRRGPAGV